MSGLITEQSRIRKHLSPTQKLEIVQASYHPGVTVAEVARKYHVGVSTLIKWRKHAIEGSLMSVKDNAPAVSASEVKRLKKEVAQLQKLLGKKSLENEILREAVAIGREKKLISLQPLPGLDDTAFDE